MNPNENIILSSMRNLIPRVSIKVLLFLVVLFRDISNLLFNAIIPTVVVVLYRICFTELLHLYVFYFYLAKVTYFFKKCVFFHNFFLFLHIVTMNDDKNIIQ